MRVRMRVDSPQSDVPLAIYGLADGLVLSKGVKRDSWSRMGVWPVTRDYYVMLINGKEPTTFELTLAVE